MAQQLQTYTLSSPGFFGVNFQDSPVDMNPSFALKAINCTIDKSGRIAARKGWSKVNATHADLGTSNVQCIGELVGNDGTKTILSAGGGFLFKGTSTLTKLTYGGGGVAPTISANNWQFTQLNGIGMFWQRGYDPLIYDPAVSTTTFRRLNEKTGTAGTVYQCNTAISAYGRVWAADTSSDKQTVVFSDIEAPHIWSGGTAGSLNLVRVWPIGGDEIVALAAHNGFLIIFGKFQTLIYSGADDPATMALSDSIVNMGCIARDSVQNTGKDVWFLSAEGVQSLGRVIQEKSSPIGEVTKNIRDEIISHIAVETMDNIKSVFSDVDSMYLITFPAASEVYCIDTRSQLENLGYRVTVWDTNIPKCFCSLTSGALYMGKAGYIGLYGTYLDDTTTYRMVYRSPYIDFGNPIVSTILKKILITTIGVNTAVVVKWAFDFIQSFRSFGFTIAANGTVGYYNVSEYNTTAEYTTPIAANVSNVNASGSGKVVQVAFEATINGNSLSVQKIDIFAKNGKIQ